MSKIAHHNSTVFSLATKAWLAAGLLASLVALSPITQAAPSEGCKGGKGHGDADFFAKGGREWRALELTTEQRDTLKQQREASRAGQQALHEQLQTARQALLTAASSGESETRLQVLAAELGHLQSQQALAQAKAQREFVALLTPEQKATLAEISAKREAKWQERKEDREARKDKWQEKRQAKTLEQQS